MVFPFGTQIIIIVSWLIVPLLYVDITSSTIDGWTEITFCTDIHGRHGNLTFHVAPPAGQRFHSSSEMSQPLQDGLAQKFCTDLHVCQLINVDDFGDLLIFPLVPPFWLTFVVLNTISEF